MHVSSLKNKHTYTGECNYTPGKCFNCTDCTQFQCSVELRNICSSCECRRTLHNMHLPYMPCLIDRLLDSNVVNITPDKVISWHRYGYTWIPDGVALNEVHFQQTQLFLKF
ncbi:hypothetical protein GJ496_011586 [Pomphorhynchus laevis]|nr:hypothetical protein GJ496_011586 [Pomphorhynchus laevis]